jgi:hypothetical protein
MNEITEGGRIWEAFAARLAEASATLRLPGAPTGRFDQAEGARYLSRLIRLGLEIYVEHGDPDFPSFYRPSHETAKMGGDNPDNLYLSATIAGDRSYRLSGNIGSVAYLSIGSKANRYAVDGTMASTGELAREAFGAAANGDFTIIASTERPSEPNVAWLPLAPDSSMLHLRQTFLERDKEVPATIAIERISGGPQVPAPLDPAMLERRLGGVADFVVNTSALFGRWAELFMSAPNEMRDWGQDMFVKAGGDPSIFYVHGYWRLAPGEALVIETDVPRCEHWNIQVNNWWMESLDYRYLNAHVNKATARLEPDERARIVISERDPGPGFGNWLTTAGHDQGFVLLRWVRADSFPIPSTRIVKLA